MSFKPTRLAKLVAAIAAIIFVGGVHLEIAAGRDLKSAPPTDASDRTNLRIANHGIDRTGKTDRGMLARESSEAATIVFNNSALPLTTIAIRLPVNDANARTKPSSPSSLPRTGNTPKKKKHMVACEGLVSSLTEVAKQLEPGRCVT